jgi:DNA polymerase
VIKAGVDINADLLTLATCKKIVHTYRKKYSKVVQFWYDTEDAAKNAVNNPGKVFKVGKTSWSYDEKIDFLKVQLPSGRNINYHKPRLSKQFSISIRAVDKKGLPFDIQLKKLKEINNDVIKKLYSKAISKKWDIIAGEEPVIRESSVLSYLKPENGKSSRTETYSGKLVENITQGAARDFMCSSMLLAHEKGYDLIMTVHDEIVAEEDEGTKPLKDFEDLLCVLPDWGEGFPVGVEGFTAKRYRK